MWLFLLTFFRQSFSTSCFEVLFLSCMLLIKIVGGTIVTAGTLQSPHDKLTGREQLLACIAMQNIKYIIYVFMRMITQQI